MHLVAISLLFTGTLLVYSQLHQIARESDDAAEFFGGFSFCLSASTLHHILPVQMNAAAVCVHALRTSQRPAALSSRRPRMQPFAFGEGGCCISVTVKHSDKVSTLCPFLFFCLSFFFWQHLPQSGIACTIGCQKSGGGTVETLRLPNCFQLLRTCLVVFGAKPEFHRTLITRWPLR